jgi:TPR repeat protein
MFAGGSYRDPDAQYYLARLISTVLVAGSAHGRAGRSLAQKGQCVAQAMLGAMLFEGDHVPRQAARGLMWLALAKDSARADQAWITKLYDSAMKQASEDERALAAVYLRRWLETRRE